MHKFSGRASALSIAVGFALAGTAHADVVISQVYGGGGNSGAQYKSDFIELHNNGSEAVDLSTWSVQYASAAGTTWARTNLSGTIAPGGYYLVKQADGTGVAAPLPTPDAIGTIAMAAGAAKVALVASQTTLAGTACPVGVADLVAYGSTATCAEGAAPTATLNSTTAALRREDGCQDSNHNANDFLTGAPMPHNRASAVRECVATARMLSVNDASVVEGDNGISRLVFTASLSQPAAAGGMRFRYSVIDATATAADGDYIAVRDAEAVIAAGESSVTLVINIAGDLRAEADETFAIELSAIEGAVAGDVSGIGTIVNDDFVLVPIHQIQGNSERSPLVGQVATTRGIVTGRKANGFFIQSLDVHADADTATSEGLFVFTRTAPPSDVVVGRVLTVRGTVTEFVPPSDPGQAPLTQLAGTVTVAASATTTLALPTPVALTTSLPAANGALDQLEHLEGMRVTVPRFTVTAPTGGFTNETQATGSSNGVLHGVVAGVARPFREPGIQAPDLPPSGSVPPIPRWDFNPELISVDTDVLGGPALDLPAGAEIADLTGPLDYGFRRYTIARDPAATGAVTAGPAPRAAKAVDADAFTVAGYNLERFFDEIDDPTTGEPRLTALALERRMAKASLAIRDSLRTPDILGLVEVENLSVLQRLAARINADAVAAGQPDPQYTGHLFEGNDIGGIDVGFLIKSAGVADATPRVAVHAVTQVGKDTTWMRPDGGIELLNDRPPLALDATVHYGDGRAFPVSVVIVHQRSLSGAEVNDASGERIRSKRQRQAEFLAAYLQGRQTNAPDTRLVVLGDFNAFEFNDGLADAMNTITGTPTPDEQTAVLADGADLVDPDLVNLGGLEPPHERYSFVFGGNAQTLDHVLVNEELIVNTRHVSLDHARINADFPETHRNDANSPSRLSDHDPVVAYFVPRRRADLVVTAFTPFSTVQAGTTLAFEVKLGNNGPEQADEPGLGFAIDAELPTLATTVPAGWNCNAPKVETGRTLVTCHADALARDAVAEFALSADATPALIGRTLRVDAVASAESIDPVVANNAAAAQLDVVSVADLGIALVGPDRPLSGGDDASYRVAVHNNSANLAVAPVMSLWGNAPAGNVTLPAPAGWRCSVDDASDGFVARCTAQSLQAASTQTFDLQVRVPRLQRAGLLNVRAGIDGLSTDVNADNDVASDVARTVPGPR